MLRFYIFPVIFLVYQVLDVIGDVPYPKRDGLDATFPPLIRPASTGIPTGHLRPLGFQRSSSGKIANTLDMPIAHAFSMKYVKQKKPVAIREGMLNLTVMTKWADDQFLKKHFGKLNVTVSSKKETIDKRKTNYYKMTIRKFLNDYRHENIYLHDIMPKELEKYLPIPGCLKCGTYRKRLQEAEMWMSYGGTSSLLHNHEDHMLHCVIFGRKDVIVIDQTYKDRFNYVEKYPNAGSGYSTMDTDMLNVIKHPQISKTPWTHSTLKEGDCLFLPAGYLHHVRSYGRCISYAILFAPSKDFDSSDCRNNSPSNKRQDNESLADADFVWRYQDGEKVLTAENMEPSTLKHILNMLLRDKNSLHYEQFQHFYDEALRQFPWKPSAQEAFDILTNKPGKDSLYRKEIENLPPTRLLHASRLFNEARIKPEINLREEL